MFIHRLSGAVSVQQVTRPHPHPPHGEELNPQDIESDLLKFGQRATGLKAEDLTDWLVQFKLADRFRVRTDNHPERLKFRKSGDIVSIPHPHSGQADGVHRQFIDHVAEVLHTHARTLARAVEGGISLGRARNIIERETRRRFHPTSTLSNTSSGNEGRLNPNVLETRRGKKLRVAG